MAEDTTTTTGAGGAPTPTATAPTPPAATGTPGAAASATGEGGAAPAANGAAAIAADGKQAAPPADAKTGEGEPKAGEPAKAGEGETAVDYSGLTVPEAWKAADDTVWQDAQKLLGEAKVSPEAAQKFIDFTLERDKLIAKGVSDANTEAWTKQAETWKAEVTKTYKPEELAGARKAVETLFDKEGIQWMEALRLTDNPSFVKAMVKVSKAIAEDKFVPGNAAVNGTRDARASFPNSNMNP